MKRRVLALVLVVIMSLSVCGTAFADEATEENTGIEKKSGLEVLDEMIFLGAKLDASSFINYSEETDPNELLGGIGQYFSKVQFYCPGYKNSEGTIECFEENEYARNRYEYLKSVFIAVPIVADQIMYLCDSYVLRVSKKVSKEDSYAIAKALGEVVGVPVEEVFDLKQKYSLEEMYPTEDSAIESVPEDLPASTVLIEKGDESFHVARLQARLKDLGYYKGAITGKCDSSTLKAFNAFQEANELEKTESMSEKDQDIMNSDMAIKSDGETATAYEPFKEIPLEVSKVAVKISKGVPYASFTVKNDSYCSCVAFSYRVMFFDEDGNQLTGEKEGTYNAVYNAKELKVGKAVTVTTNRASDMYDYTGGKTCKVAITKIMMADGNTVIYDSPLWVE